MKTSWFSTDPTDSWFIPAIFWWFMPIDEKTGDAWNDPHHLEAGKNDGSVHGKRYFQCKDKWPVPRALRDEYRTVPSLWDAMNNRKTNKLGSDSPKMCKFCAVDSVNSWPICIQNIGCLPHASSARFGATHRAVQIRYGLFLRPGAVQKIKASTHYNDLYTWVQLL